MKSKLVVIECGVILLLALLTTQSNGNINYETDTQPKNESPKTKRYSLNNQPDHLFHFVQVSIWIVILSWETAIVVKLNNFLIFVLVDFRSAYQPLSGCAKNRKLSTICSRNIGRYQTTRYHLFGWPDRRKRTKLFDFASKRWRMGNLQGNFKNSQCSEPNQMVGSSGKSWWVTWSWNVSRKIQLLMYCIYLCRYLKRPHVDG